MTLLSIALLSPSSWTVIGAPLGNHLWQSTVFAGAVWLLTLLLRKSHAQSRYVLWLIASAKFLVPFSLLIGLGSHLPWSRTPAVTQPGVFLAMETFGEPFAPVNPARVAPPTLSALEVAARFLPAFLMVGWSIGCAAVLLVWYLRWRRLTAARRAAVPLHSGRELEALRHIEQTTGLSHQIDLLLSKSSLEPGILGIFRPALLLPSGISDKLTDAQLESVIAHELCHVRRRDNLAAALHMLVEGLFWFHPLVWWMGTRLVEERERACDEEVLRFGADPHLYAEGILKICKFYLESPQFCAAGVTGSNLKKRIEAIMSNRIAPSLDWSKKLLLSTMGVAAIIGPVVFGLLHVTQSTAQAQSAPSVALAFDSVSIQPNTTGEPMAGFVVKGRPMRAVLFKPDRFMATNFTLRGLIRVAYGVQDSQITGGPGWLDSEKYDIEAILGNAAVDELSKLGEDQMTLDRERILQALLADQFKLALHQEIREVPGYALVVAKNGPKIHQAKPGDTYSKGSGASAEPGKFVGQGSALAPLVTDLGQSLRRPVVDQTGLSGKFDYTLQWTQGENPDGSASAESIESLFKALPQQLGLELRAQTVPFEMLVVDHAEEPTSAESSQTQKQTQRPENSQAANGPASPEGSLTCMFAGVKYPEGTIVVQGDGREHLCVRVLDPGKADENSQPQYTVEWVRTSPELRERGKNVIHPPVGPPAVCTPKPSAQSNLCSCEESSPWSENAIVDSTSGRKLNCKKGKWVPIANAQAKQVTPGGQVADR